MVIAPVTLVLHLLEKARRNACQDSRSPRDPPPGRHCLHCRGRHPPHLSPPSAPAVTGRGCRGEGGVRGNVGGAVCGDGSGGGGGEGGDGVGRMDAAVAVTLLLSLPLRSPAGSRRERY